MCAADASRPSTHSLAESAPPPLRSATLSVILASAERPVRKPRRIRLPLSLQGREPAMSAAEGTRRCGAGEGLYRARVFSRAIEGSASGASPVTSRERLGEGSALQATRPFDRSPSVLPSPRMGEDLGEGPQRRAPQKMKSGCAWRPLAARDLRFRIPNLLPLPSQEGEPTACWNMNRGCEQVGEAVADLFRAATGRSIFLDQPLQHRFQNVLASLAHSSAPRSPGPLRRGLFTEHLQTRVHSMIGGASFTRSRWSRMSTVTRTLCPTQEMPR